MNALLRFYDSQMNTGLAAKNVDGSILITLGVFRFSMGRSSGLLLGSCPGNLHRKVAVAIKAVHLGFGVSVMAHRAGDVA